MASAINTIEMDCTAPGERATTSNDQRPASPSSALFMMNFNALNPEEKQLLLDLNNDEIDEEDMDVLEKERPHVFEWHRQCIQGKLALFDGEPVTTNNISLPPSSPTTNTKQKRTREQETIDSPQTKKPNAEFVMPPKRHTAVRNSAPPPTAPTTTSNNFKNLRETILNDKNVPQPSTSYSKPKEDKNKKVKHIGMFKSTNYMRILNKIAESPERKFHIKHGIGGVIRIFPETEDAHRAITSFLEANNHDFFLVEPGTIRPLKVVIRGLPSDFPQLDIEDQLQTLGYQITKVNQLISRKDQRPMPLFQIQLEDNPHNQTIYKLETLFHTKIVVEKYNSPFRVQQCHSCQNFHHNSLHCHMKKRCVKCIDPHTPENCPKGKGHVDNPECCNCGGNHAASYRGCTKFPKPYKTNNNPKFPIAKKVNAGFSYAQAASTNLPQNPSTNRNQPNNLPILNEFSELNEVINAIKAELKIESFAQLTQNLKNILENLKAAPTHENKMFLFMDSIQKIHP